MFSCTLMYVYVYVMPINYYKWEMRVDAADYIIYIVTPNTTHDAAPRGDRTASSRGWRMVAQKPSESGFNLILNSFRSLYFV